VSHSGVEVHQKLRKQDNEDWVPSGVAATPSREKGSVILTWHKKGVTPGPNWAANDTTKRDLSRI
jgi:hypothetical protein